jgi:hypothetical protein
MQLAELLQLGRQVRAGCGCRRGRGRRWSILLLLRLCIGCALLVGIIILLLSSRILLRILLLLVVAYRSGRTGDDCRSYRNACHTSSHPSSSHHFDLRSYLLIVFSSVGFVLGKSIHDVIDNLERDAVVRQHPAFGSDNGFPELDRPQVFKQQHCRGGVIFHCFGDRINIFDLNDPAHFDIQRIEDFDEIGSQLLHFDCLVTPILIFLDNHKIDYPHDLVLDQIEQRWQDLALELIRLEIKRE